MFDRADAAFFVAGHGEARRKRGRDDISRKRGDELVFAAVRAMEDESRARVRRMKGQPRRAGRMDARAVEENGTAECVLAMGETAEWPPGRCRLANTHHCSAGGAETARVACVQWVGARST